MRFLRIISFSLVLTGFATSSSSQSPLDVSTNPLISAVLLGNVDGVGDLAKGGSVNVADNLGNTALMTAILLRNLAIVKVLLQNGANVAMTDRSGDTPLICASKQVPEQLEIVNALLEKGADVKQFDRSGNTALMYAVHLWHLRITEA